MIGSLATVDPTLLGLARLGQAAAEAEAEGGASAFVELLLLLAIIVVGAKLSGLLATRVGQPSVLGEIIFGLLLGPSLLNLLELPLFHHAAVLGETTQLMAEIGVVMLMFLAGMETDIDGMRRVGLPATAAAIGGALLPFAAGWAIGAYFGLSTAAAIFLGTILTATSVSISAQTLIELGQLRSKEGTTILGAAVIDDVLGILVLSIVVATFADGGGQPIWLIVLRMIGFFVLALLLARPARRLLRLFDGLPVSEPIVAGALVIFFLYAWAAEYIGGVAAITGSYLAGIILAQMNIRHVLEEKVEVMVYGLFVPIFFVAIGLSADVRAVFAAGGTVLTIAMVVIVASIVFKLVGAGGGALLTGYSPMESLRVGTGMISRGEVGLIVAGVGISRGLIQNDVFSIVVLMVIVTTLITPLLLRLVFPPDATEAPSA